MVASGEIRVQDRPLALGHLNKWHPEGWRDAVEMEGHITRAGFWQRGRGVSFENSRHPPLRPKTSLKFAGVHSPQ